MNIAAKQEFPFWDDFIVFCKRLIQTPSISGKEGDVAQLIRGEMKILEYDEVWTDSAGNVIALLKGNSNLPTLCFTGHMDTVPPGDERNWEYPPFSGEIAEGFLHGRGAGDMKCSLGAQVYLPAVLHRAGLKPVDIGDIYVVAVVQEEVGGLGSKYLDESIKKVIDYAINGESTSNMINTGQRGRAELAVSFTGKAAHASRPWQGVNPFFDLAQFLLDLKDLEMAGFGDSKSTVAPTVCRSDTDTSNVIPGQCTLTLDWRDVPGESESMIIDRIKSILPKSGLVQFVEYDLKTYTGQVLRMKRRKLPFSIDVDHVLVKAMVRAVGDTLHSIPQITWWQGATDCGYFAEAGIPIVGFGPSESRYSHTSRERISLEMLRDAMRCFPAIVANISSLEKRRKKKL